MSLMLDPAFAWSNRGHRMVNLAAATELPVDMPAFLHTLASIHEIAYLGPEPDRWRPVTEPELSAASSPDHAFFLERGELLAPLPRRRYEYLRKLATYRDKHPDTGNQFTPMGTGMLPWQVLEVYQRLKSSFRSYRVLTGDLPRTSVKDIEPMTAEDLPSVEQTCLFYAGWLGHYLGDGSQPLHATVNHNGWEEKNNPHGFTTKRGIHTAIEAETDKEIAARAVTLQRVEKSMTKSRYLNDVFTDVIPYLRISQEKSITVYVLEKDGHLNASSPEFQEFTARRLAAGASMLRDAIYSAWIDSKSVGKPQHSGS